MGSRRTREKLIERRGYLKVPDEFRDKFGTPKKYPNPVAFVEMSGGNGKPEKVKLVYEWDVGSDGKLVERGE